MKDNYKYEVLATKIQVAFYRLIEKMYPNICLRYEGKIIKQGDLVRFGLKKVCVDKKIKISIPVKDVIKLLGSDEEYESINNIRDAILSLICNFLPEKFDYFVFRIIDCDSGHITMVWGYA